MVKFLIATHGFLADGFKSTISVLMGEEIANNILAINAFVEGGSINPKKEIDDICSSIKEDETLIILTDVMYGSVNQFAMPYVDNEKVFCITGINFPLILEVISKLTFGMEEAITLDSLKEIVEKSKEQIICVENIEVEDNNEEDFFG